MVRVLSQNQNGTWLRVQVNNDTAWVSARHVRR